MKLTELVLLRVDGGAMDDMTLVAFGWIHLVSKERRNISTISIVHIKALCRELNQ